MNGALKLINWSIDQVSVTLQILATKSCTTAKTTGSLRAMCMKLKNNNNEHLSVVSLWVHLSNKPKWPHGFELIVAACALEVSQALMISQPLNRKWKCNVYKYWRKPFATTGKVSNQTWMAKEVFSQGPGVMQMNFDASGRYVNTYRLTKTDFYVLSRAIQDDTHHFKTKERLSKVRSLLWCEFSLHLDFEILFLKFGWARKEQWLLELESCSNSLR